MNNTELKKSFVSLEKFLENAEYYKKWGIDSTELKKYYNDLYADFSALLHSLFRFNLITVEEYIQAQTKFDVIMAEYKAI